MADNMSYEQLRALTPKQLEVRISHIEGCQKQYGISEDVKTSLANALTAAKSILEVKKLTGIMLQAKGKSEEELGRTYFNMDKEQLMDAYDHYATSQRKLVEQYVDIALVQKRIVGSDPDHKVDNGWRELAITLEVRGMPDLKEVFQSIECVPIPMQKNGEGSLEEAIESYHEDMGY